MEMLEKFHELRKIGFFRKLFTGTYEAVPATTVIVKHNGEDWWVEFFFDNPNDKNWRSATCRRGTIVKNIPMRKLSISSLVWGNKKPRENGCRKRWKEVKTYVQKKRVA